MKTPKRIAYCSCGCALNLESGDYMDDKGKFHNAAALFCPKCGAAHPGEAFAARCTRKNREARSKNTIRHLKQTVAELEHDCRERGEAVEELLEQNKQAYLEIEALKSANREIAVWLKELCEQKEPTLLQTRPIDRLVKLYAHKRHRVPCSTYGQDIEGS